MIPVGRFALTKALACAILVAACAPSASSTAQASRTFRPDARTAPPTATALLTPILTSIPTPTSTASTTSAPTGSPSPAASPAAAGTPSAGCVHGWSRPAPDVPLHAEGLDILSGYMGVEGEWQVDELRYFAGPDAPWMIEPHYEVVERWYVKAALVDDPDFRGRWLLEKRTERIKGVSAVAPYDSTGYTSPDWSGFVGDGPSTEYPGLPGVWFGIRYDFVTGEGDSGQPGLPDEVVDCLAGS